MIRPTFMILVLFGGCTRPSVVEVGPTLAPFRETIAQNASSAVVLDGFSWALSDVDQVWRVEEPDNETTSIGREVLHLWDAASTPAGVTYVATDQGLRVLERELLETDVDAFAGEPIRTVNAWSGAVWLEGEEETLVVADGEVFGLQLDERIVSGTVLRADSRDEAWVFAEGLQRIYWRDGGVAVLETAPTPWAKWSARSQDGTIWAARQFEVSKRVDGMWSRYELPSAVRGMMANESSDVVWVRTEDGWLVWQGESVRPVEGVNVDANVLGVDVSGRLWVQSEGSVERFGVAYSTQVKGIAVDEVIDVEVWAEVVPAFADDVREVAVWLNGDPAEYTPDGVSIEPTELGDGAHEFRAAVTYMDDTVVEKFVPFSVGEIEIPTWKDDIRPIFKADCSKCHDGDSESVLNTSQSWRDQIDEIVQYVSTGTMPLSDDPLVPEDVAKIRAWRATGMME